MFNNKIPINNNDTRINSLALFFFIVCSCIIFLFIIVNPTSIGLSYDWVTPQTLNYFIRAPLNTSWVDNHQIIPGNHYYVLLLYWFLLNVHISNNVITLIFLVSMFSLSAFSIYLLIKKIQLPPWIAAMVGLLYLTSSQLFLVTHHGYTSYITSFSFTPLLIYLFLRYLEKPKFTVALAGAIVLNFTASQIQFFVINFIILLVFSFFNHHHWKSIVKMFSIFLVVNVLLSASWLLVYLSNPSGIASFGQGLLQNSYQGFQNNSIMDLFYLPFVSWSVKDYLQIIHLKWLYNIWTFCQIIIFGLPFFAYGLYRKKISSTINTYFLIGFVLFLTGLILTKGRAEPFSWLGDWLYRLPLSGMFRDLNHFYYLITFSVVWLFALAVYVLHANINKEKKYQRIFFGALILFVTLNVSPYLLNVYRSRLHQYQLSNAYSSLISSYNNDQGDYRLLWLPTGFYVKYNDNQPLYSGINPLIYLVAKQDIGSLPNQSPLLIDVVQFGYCQKIKNCTERFLGLNNVRDVINLKRDFSSAIPSYEDKNSFRNEIDWMPEYYNAWSNNLSDTVKTQTNDLFDTYQLSNEQFLPHIYVPNELTWIAGDDRSILDGIILNNNNQSGYLVNNNFRDNVKKLIVPLEFTEDSALDVTHNSYQIITKMNVPEDGIYQVVYYQKHRDTTSPGLVFTVKDVNLDKKTVLLEKKDNSSRQLEQNNPLYSGKIFFRKGEYELALSNTINNQNLIINPSFEFGGWPEPTYNCVSEESDYTVSKTEEREHYLQFHNTKRSVCQTRVVGNLQPHQKYLFSYDIQHVSGEQPVVCLKLNEQDYCHGINAAAGTTDWQHHEFVYEQGESGRALIYFSVPGSSHKSINNFDNFELRQVGLPETISFVKERDPAAYHVSQVEYRKINNTKYRVVLKAASGNVPVIFTENYNDNWQAYVKSESDSQPNAIQNSSGNTILNNSLPAVGLWETRNLQTIDDHHTINGYSNVWYYQAGSKPKDVEIVIEYKPQKMFIIGQYISIATFGLIILFLIVRNFLKVSFIEQNRADLP